MEKINRSATAKRSRNVSFRLTEAEFEQLRIEAEKIGLSVNELSRSFARTPKGRITVNVGKKVDAAYLAQLKKIGNNLNQMVKNSHIFGRPSEKLEQVCDEVLEIIFSVEFEDR